MSSSGMTTTKTAMRRLMLLLVFIESLALDRNAFCSSFAPSSCFIAERRSRVEIAMVSSVLAPRSTLGPSSRYDWNSTVFEADEWLAATATTESRIKSKDDDGRSDEFVATITDYFTSGGEGGGGGDIPASSFGSTGSESGGRKRGNIQLVAGSGKTYVAWKVMERLLLPGENDGLSSRPPRIGLYVTPFLNLVDQALNNREEHGIMMSSAEATVETMIVASKTSRKRELCSTDADKILAFLTDATIPSTKILVCTYNSLPKIGAALRLLRNEYDTAAINFAVFDEAHKMEGLTRPGERNAARFSYGLYDSNIDIRNRLFMSGTPNNYTQDARVVKVLPTRPRPDGTRVFIPKRDDGKNRRPKNGEFPGYAAFPTSLSLDRV